MFENYCQIGYNLRQTRRFFNGLLLNGRNNDCVLLELISLCLKLKMLLSILQNRKEGEQSYTFCHWIAVRCNGHGIGHNGQRPRNDTLCFAYICWLSLNILVIVVPSNVNVNSKNSQSLFLFTDWFWITLNWIFFHYPHQLIYLISFFSTMNNKTDPNKFHPTVFFLNQMEVSGLCWFCLLNEGSSSDALGIWAFG